MSDDISIPSASGARTAYTHSYRSRRSNGIDPGTRLLMLGASVLGLVLVGGMAVWSLGGHRQAVGVPLIEADVRPLRVKPADPGGMSVSIFGDASTSGQSSGQTSGHTGASDLAPVAERPDPQALLAQRQAGAAPPLTTVAASVAPLPATPTQATPLQAAPLEVAPAIATSGPVAKPAAASLLVQLAAVSSEAGATAEWQRLSRKLPDLLGSRQPVIQRAELSGKPVWRLRTGGFGDVADATQFCKRARDKGVGCALASF